MTAVLEADPQLGSTKPRLYTPPLEVNCTGPKIDLLLNRRHPMFGVPQECACGCGLNPQTSWGFTCIEFLEKILKWDLLSWQRWLYIHSLEKRPDGTGFRFRQLIVLVGRQQGKALDRATPILTTDGWSTMGELQVGDAVFHPDGTPTCVVGTFDQPDGRDCYEVTTTDGRSIVADAEHLWTVQDRRRKTRCGKRGERPEVTYQWETLTTAELLKRGLKHGKRGRAFRMPRQQSIQSKPTDLPIDPWILGAWLGDGTADMACINTGDDDAPEMIDQLVAAGATITGTHRYPTAWRIGISVGDAPVGPGIRNGLISRLQDLGVWKAKAIPAPYLTAGTEQRLSLLQGLLDTDGHISEEGQVEFTSTNRNLADGVLYLARSLGFRATLTEGRASLEGRDCGPKYRVRFTPSTDDPIMFRLPRKVARIKDHPMRHTGRQAVSIDTISQVQSRPVRCIKVARDDGMFLAGRDLMPTHNTTWGRGLGLWRLFMDDSGRRDPKWPAAKLCVVAAQNLDYAENTLKDVVDEIREHPLLESELINHAVTNGKHRAILKNNRLWRAATANRKGGRSLPVDFAWLDEVREHTTWDAYNAIEPTTTMQVCSQLLVTSNAGDQRSIVLKGLRDTQIRDLMVGDTTEAFSGFFEWSVPDDVDPREPKYWHMSAPAMGHKIRSKDDPVAVVRLTLDDLIGKFKAKVNTDMAGFQTEYLALDVNTPILTTSGWKTMSTMEVDDYVFHPDGHPIRVVGVTAVHDERECFEVLTTDGRRVVADAQHRWTVQDRRRSGGTRIPSWETVTTQELVDRGVTRNRTGGAYAYRLPRQHTIVSKPADLPIDPYLLGVWLGDGTTGKSEVCCIEDEADELTTLMNINVTSTRTVGNARYINFRITPKKSRDGFPARCRELGIWNDKNIPDTYLTGSAEQRLALLQGLCDTDGSIDPQGRVRFCATRKELAEQVLYLARSLGWRATLTEGVSSYAGKVYGLAYMVSWTHDQSESPPFRLARKVARINTRPSRAGERTTVSIRSITPVSPRPVRCITVDSPDSLFLAGRDLIPTANCQWVDSLQAGIIPSQAWADRLDEKSRRAPGSPVYACIEVNYHRTKSYVCVASRREDGDIHIEVIKEFKGTDGITTWFNEPDPEEGAPVDDNGVPLARKHKFAAICAQKSGAPVSTELEEFRKAGLKIIEWGAPTTQLATGAGEFYDAIVGEAAIKVWHIKQPTLERSAASTVSRSVLDSWFFDRKRSPVDASPIIGCCGAMWLLNNSAGGGPPEIWEWPDEDTLDQWRKEAEEQWEDDDE